MVSPISSSSSESSESEMRSLESGLGLEVEVEVEGVCFGLGFEKGAVVGLCVVVVVLDDDVAPGRREEFGRRSSEDEEVFFFFTTWADSADLTGLWTGVPGPLPARNRDGPGTGLGMPLRPPGIGVRPPRPFSAFALASSRKWR